MWPQAACVALGLWLMASPALLGYGGPADTVSWILGPIVASVAFMAAFAITRGLRWLHVPLGATLLVAPWALGFDGRALANALAVGAAVVVLTLLTPAAGDRYAGGWSSLLR